MPKIKRLKFLKEQGVQAYLAANNPTEIKPVCFLGAAFEGGFSVALYVEDGVITGVDVCDDGEIVTVLGSAVTGEYTDRTDRWYLEDGLYVDEDTLRKRAFQTAGTNVPQEPQVLAAGVCTDPYGCFSCPDPDTCDNLRRAEYTKPSPQRVWFSDSEPTSWGVDPGNEQFCGLCDDPGFCQSIDGCERD